MSDQSLKTMNTNKNSFSSVLWYREKENIFMPEIKKQNTSAIHSQMFHLHTVMGTTMKNEMAKVCDTVKNDRQRE